MVTLRKKDRIKVSERRWMEFHLMRKLSRCTEVLHILQRAYFTTGHPNVLQIFFFFFWQFFFHAQFPRNAVVLCWFRHHLYNSKSFCHFCYFRTFSKLFINSHRTDLKASKNYATKIVKKKKRKKRNNFTEFKSAGKVQWNHKSINKSTKGAHCVQSSI